MTCNTHTHWVNIHDFKCIYVIQYESTHAWSALILAPKKIENKKLHFIIKGQISIKTAIVREWLENNQVLSFQSGFRDLKNDRIWCCRFFQTEQTVNRKKSGFRAAPFFCILNQWNRTEFKLRHRGYSSSVFLSMISFQMIFSPKILYRVTNLELKIFYF